TCTSVPTRRSSELVARMAQLARVRPHGHVHARGRLDEPQSGRGCHGEAARPPADAGAVGDAGGRVGKDVPALPDPADLAGAGREPKRLPPEAGVTEDRKSTRLNS